MSRPGVEVTSAAAAPPVGVPTDTSVFFVVSEAAQGPLDAPTRVTSLDEFTATYGSRITGVEGYDALDAYFHEGGSSAYFMRMAQDAALATADAAAIVAGNTVNAANEGVWGNDLELSVVDTPGGTTLFAGEGRSTSKKNGDKPERSKLLTYDATPQAGVSTFMATIKQAGTIVAVSQPITTRRELSAFLQLSNYLVLIGPDTDDPIAAGDVTLAGGDDGTVPVVDPDTLPAALDLIPKELGPGQVSAPGKSSYDDHAALLAHAELTDRYALLDGDPTDDAVALTSKAAVLRGAEQDRYGMLWGPWAVVPGIAPGTFRTVPWSAIEAGIIARNDAAGNPNQAAAGAWGVSQYALDLSQSFSNAEMEALLYAGVCTARKVYGAIEAYAFRSLVDPSGPRQEWLQANWGRTSMAIVAQCEADGEDFVFSQIDGRGLTIAAFNGRLAATCKTFYDDGALYGEDVTEAFIVNTGPAVNTPDSISDGRLRAVLSVRMSPHAELVQIQIVKYPITVSLV